MPTDVSPRVGLFDRFAGHAAHAVSQAFFFTFCVVLVLAWLPTIAVFRDADTWQLVINTITTVITFLLVALIQNSQSRSDLATQHKLNALAEGLSRLMELVDDGTNRDLRADIVELRSAVGLEQRESTSRNLAEQDLADKL